MKEIEELEYIFREIKAYHNDIKLDGFKPVDSIYIMIKEYAVYISIGKDEEAIFYTSLIKLMNSEGIDINKHFNIKSSFENVFNEVDEETKKIIIRFLNNQ